MKPRVLTAAGLLLLAGVVLSDASGNPGPFQPEFAITPQSGAWLICAASYTGPQAGALAQELAQIIRQDYKLAAYIFDRGKDERRKQQEEIEKVRKLSPEGRVRMVRIEDQFAVLVGGYPDMNTARKALDEFKKVKAPPDKFCDRGTVQSEGSKDGQKGVWVKEVLYSPFRTCFVVHNPTLPQEQANKGSDYPFLKQLNSEESFSLLRCPKQWTLAIQTFYGGCVIQPQSQGSKFLDMLPFGSKSGDKLNAAALQAHELASVLRKMKPVSFDAYVLHTRSSSVVTIGAYDGPNDPKMLQDQQLLSKLKLQGSSLEIVPKPLPMEVPKP